MNPLAAARSALYFPGLEAAAGGRLRLDVALDYASAIERNIEAEQPRLLLDAELLRLELGAARGLGSKGFVLARLPILGAYDGFLDGAVNAYHDLFGVPFPERTERPRNRFAYQLVLPDGRAVARGDSGLFLGDLRLGIGRRHGDRRQSLLTLTLPTATGPDGYGKGTVGLAFVHTVRHALHPRLALEASAGAGFTPRHGELESVQRQAFASASAGLAWQVHGRSSLYGNFFAHSPYYQGTRMDHLDRSDLALDLGFARRTASGKTWRVGLTEDPVPRSPGVDVVFRLGLSF